MKLSIIRHGESLGNIRQSNIADCALSPRGEEQAKRVMQLFHKIEVSHIYSSPLTRTLQTAAPLAADQHLSIIFAPEMCEYFNEAWTEYGEYPWKTTSQLLEDWPVYKADDDRLPDDKWWPAWPETPLQAEKRVAQFYHNILSKHAGTEDEVVVFGHGHTCGLLRNLVDPKRITADIPGAINGVVFQYELNETGVCHSVEVLYDHLEGCLSPKKNRKY